MQKVITYDKLVEDFKAIGLKKGDIVNVKISLKSIGKVEGGAKTVIDALKEVLTDEGTIVSESFVKVYPFKNVKADNTKYISSDDSVSYAGAITNTMLKDPNVYRSKHPIHKFALIGKLAKQLAEEHDADAEAYGVLAEMIKMNGKNLRVGGADKVVGVGTTHVAIEHSGKRAKTPNYGVNYVDDNGTVKPFKINWAGGACAVGFNNLLPLFREKGAFIKEGFVGKAEAILSDMKSTYEIESQLIKQSIKNVTCDNPMCVSCRLSWEELKKPYLTTIFHLIKSGNIRKLKLVMQAFFRHYQPDS